MSPYIYAAIAIVGGLLGAFLTHAVEGGRYAHLETTFANYKAAAASQRALDSLAAQAVLQAQIDNATKVSKENDSVISDLHAKLAAADATRATDRAAAVRLFHNACSAAGGQVPQGPGVAGAIDPSQSQRLDQVANACGDLAVEDRENADQLDALQAQIRPQL